MARSSRSRVARKPEAGKPAQRRPRPAKQPDPEPKPKRARPQTVEIPHDERIKLYAAARYLPSDTREAVGLKIKVVTYFKDPAVAKSHPGFGLDDHYMVDWEPGLADGPTSARFEIVDYNTDTRKLEPPVQWDTQRQVYRFGGRPLGAKTVGTFQFHQLMVWARAAGTGVFRGWQRPGPADSLGIRGQPAHRRAARRVRRERVLRPPEQVSPVLLLRNSQGYRFYLPFDRHRLSRVRACRAGRRSALLQPEHRRSNRRLPRIHGGPYRDSSVHAQQ